MLFHAKTLIEVTQHILFFLVLYIATKILYFLVRMFYSYVLPKLGFSCDLKKYGEWAVVTGATDGIGKEYAIQLAEKGFSVVLISRSKDRLNSVAEEIMLKYKVLTKTITYDFTRTDGYDMISDQLKGLDIGILVNNVGRIHEKLVGHDDTELANLFDDLNVNILSAVGMTHIVTQMMAQQKRGLIIYISSLATEVNVPVASIYASAKYFLHKFSSCLIFDHDKAIHHQIVVPGYVVTKLSRSKKSFIAPFPKDYVRSALGTAGRLNFTYGYWVHELQSFISSMFPESAVNRFVLSVREDSKKVN